MKLFRLAVVSLIAASAFAQSSPNYNFKVHVVAGPQRNMAHLTIFSLPDVMFTASTDYAPGGGEQVITAERDGRTFRIVLRTLSDGGGTAEFQVREKGAVIAQDIRPFTAPGRSDFGPIHREFDPKFPPVGGEIKAPVVYERMEPLYPEEARKARISGIVIVETKIDENGSVVDVKVLKSLPFGLDQAAVDAVKQWKFRPGTKDGQPIAVTFLLTVNFKLAELPPTSPTHNQP